MMTRHLTAACFLFCTTLFAGITEAATQSYDAEYEKLLAELSGSLNNTEAAQALVDKTDELYEHIRQHRRENRESLSDEQSDELQDLYKEVRSFKGFVRVFGQLHNAAYTDIDKFDAVLRRLGLEPRVLQKHEDSGLELVRVDIASFGSILVRNPGKTTYTLRYTTNDPERSGGIGTANCESYSVMSGLYNSRDRKIEDIAFTLMPFPVAAVSCD